MIKKRSVIWAGILLQFSAFTQADTFQAPLVEQSLLLDASSKDFAVVVGERGHVLIASSPTVPFQQVNMPLTTTLTAVDTIGDSVYVAGHDATIMFSADKGQSWKVQLNQPELERPFLDILFFDEAHGISVGAYGLFYRTEDGGDTWTSELHASLLNPLDIEYLEEIKAEDESFYEQELNSILPHINRVYLNNGRLYAAGETGLLAYSDDQGRSWQRYELDYAGSFFDIRQLSDDLLIAAGLRGAVYVHNGDNAWTAVDSCTTATLNSIIPTDDGNVLIVGNNGAVLTVDIARLQANSSGACGENGVKYQQIPSKSAIATVISKNESATAVTADGLYPLTLK
ncbi:WD40/YVTN/BNR-like repeat-containing protein [Alteromonas facilis]|uniref:WD40/YVTN/BNR-like repeat-containing protein n=1 Tax=Alteromonas facilis TaxID=2048004 RepID=UPI000C290F40|nr:YCF48-related protein [Alteromonas facilis]